MSATTRFVIYIFFLAMTRLLLADDHTMLRNGIWALLSAEPDLEAVGEASNGAEVLTILETHRQNIVAKTQAKNTAALIKLAVSRGLIS